MVVSSLRHLTPETVEALQGRLSVLCRERQELRSRHAEASELEQNRLEIARLQWRLSHALIERHLPRSAHEHAA